MPHIFPEYTRWIPILNHYIEYTFIGRCTLGVVNFLSNSSSMHWHTLDAKKG